MMPRNEWLAALGKKVVSAGVLFFNAGGDLLVVEPTYKDRWEIPGGVVEALESPFAVAAREVKEELGLDVVIRDVLCVDWKMMSDTVDSLQMVLDGGVLTPAQIGAIMPCPDELKSMRFVDRNMAAQLLGVLWPRVALALEARDRKTCYWLDHGAR